MRHLKKRFQFLNAARGARSSGRFFVLQSAKVENKDWGIGYTVTKKMGNSPQRNRIKRRLRGAVLTCKNQFADQHDYVLIGRTDVLHVPFAILVERLQTALKQAHKKLKVG